MTSLLLRSATLLAALAITRSASAQQAAASQSEAPVSPPTWDVLMRPRTHVPTPTTASISAADLKTRLYIFADDSMQGRLLATAGNVKGAEYIAGELKRMGITPMGDNGTYFQAINIVERKYDPASKLAVGATEFAPWSDFA